MLLLADDCINLESANGLSQDETEKILIEEIEKKSNAYY